MDIRSRKKKLKRTRLKSKKGSTQATEKLSSKAKSYIKGEDQLPVEDSVRITNQTVAEHREQVLKGARRFIYPLEHSKHRIAIISSLIAVGLLCFFFIYSALALYRYQSASDLVYRVTQVIPFPVARVDGDFIRYEEYLFELRQNIHYYANQETIDFSDEGSEKLLENLRRQALERVKENAVTRKLAKENGIEVTREEIQDQIELLRSRGGISQSDEPLENILQDYYGWQVGDLRRALEIQLLKQKLIPILDTETKVEAELVLKRIRAGEDFGALAVEYSDDEFTKSKKGELGPVANDNSDLPDEFIEAAFALKEAEVSDVVSTSFVVEVSGRTVQALHIIRNVKTISETERELAHILFIYRDSSELLIEQLSSTESSEYINVEKNPEEAQIIDGKVQGQAQAVPSKQQ